MGKSFLCLFVVVVVPQALAKPVIPLNQFFPCLFWSLVPLVFVSSFLCLSTHGYCCLQQTSLKLYLRTCIHVFLIIEFKEIPYIFFKPFPLDPLCCVFFSLNLFISVVLSLLICHSVSLSPPMWPRPGLELSNPSAPASQVLDMHTCNPSCLILIIVSK